MPFPLIPLAIGAVVGGIKNADEAKKAAEERKRQAAMTRYSPWTGLQGSTVKDPSFFGNVTQGAATGAALGQAYGADAAAPVAESGAAQAAPSMAQSYSPSVMGQSSGGAGYSLSGPGSSAMKYSLGSAGSLGGAGKPMVSNNPWMGFSNMDQFNDPNDPFGVNRPAYMAQK